MRCLSQVQHRSPQKGSRTNGPGKAKPIRLNMQNQSGQQASHSNRFDTKIHTDQIEEYLPLLNEKALKLINRSQEQTDSVIPIYGGQYTNPYHFDNNKLSESTAKINEGYREAIKIFKSNPDEIFKYFGRITHALQDFYSHSNWYELSKAGFTGNQRLLDEGYGFFEELKPLKQIGSTRVVALEKGFSDPITAWGRTDEWLVDSESYVVSSTTDRGELIGGLMTGEVNGLLYGSGNSVAIVDTITNQRYDGFDHGGLAGTISKRFLGPLAKDKIRDRYHGEVLALARDQIQNELVRLLSLIEGQYGSGGLRRFSELFVREKHQDEFRALIKNESLDVESLNQNRLQNTLEDNQGNDDVLQSFFADGDPDIEPIPDKHLLPKEIRRYRNEIEDGQFRWREIVAGIPGESAGDFILQIRGDGGWFNTGFTSNEFLDYR